MSTLAALEQKYFPPGLAPGVPNWKDTLVIPHVDGNAYFSAIADALDACQGPGDRIYITSWCFVPVMPLRRTGSPLLADILVDKAASGADVRIIVAAPRYGFGASNASPSKVDYWLGMVGGRGLGSIVSENIRAARALRSQRRGGTKPLEDRILLDWAARDFDARHEKTTIIYNAATDELRAFIGGLDFRIDRMADELHDHASWHDAGVELLSGAAAAAAANFVTRWTEARTLPAQRYRLDGIVERFNPVMTMTAPTLPAQPSALPATVSAGQYLGASVRSLRSYDRIRLFSPWLNEPNLPWQTLPPQGIQEVSGALRQAIAAASSYIYVEDQSLNPHGGVVRIYMSHSILYPSVSAACARGVKVIFVTQGIAGPDSPMPTNLTMSDEIDDLILSPLTPAQRQNFALYYVADVKVHAKVVLIDDEFASIGSANFWNRSMTGIESELSAGIVHTGGESSLIADLRVRLWRGHLRVAASTAVDAELRDRSRALGIFRASWGAGVTFPRPDNALVEIAP